MIDRENRPSPEKMSDSDIIQEINALRYHTGYTCDPVGSKSRQCDQERITDLEQELEVREVQYEHDPEECEECQAEREILADMHGEGGECRVRGQAEEPSKPSAAAITFIVAFRLGSLNIAGVAISFVVGELILGWQISALLQPGVSVLTHYYLLAQWMILTVAIGAVLVLVFAERLIYWSWWAAYYLFPSVRDTLSARVGGEY